MFLRCRRRKGGTEEILATFNGELADRHPPTGPIQDADGVEQPGREGVRLLTWGNPYLTAWLARITHRVPSGMSLA
jgi:hypothetical protein